MCSGMFVMLMGIGHETWHVKWHVRHVSGHGA